MVKAISNELDIEFKKRTMRTFLMENRILQAVGIEDIADETERALLANFASFVSRTDSMKLGKKAGALAKGIFEFWETAKDETDYSAMFEHYLETLPLSANNIWFDALQDFEQSDPMLNDPDLFDASMMNETSSDDFLSANAETGEKKNVAS